MSKDITINSLKELSSFTTSKEAVCKMLMIRMGKSIKLDADSGELLKQMLERNSTVERLWIYVDEVNDAGMKLLTEAIGGSKCLQLFAIWNSNMTDKQLVDFSKMLKTHSAISRIEIVTDSNDGACFGDEGFKAAALAVSENSVIREVEISPTAHKRDGIDFEMMRKIISSNGSIKEIMLPEPVHEKEPELSPEQVLDEIAKKIADIPIGHLLEEIRYSEGHPRETDKELSQVEAIGGSGLTEQDNG